MPRKQEHLTKNEEEVMEIFWEAGEALTSIDVYNRREKEGWSNGYVHNLLRALVKKSMLSECGMKRYTTQYARQFLPTLTRNEYAAGLIFNFGAKKKVSVPQLAVQLAQEEEDMESVIAELEEMLREYRERNKESDEEV